MGLEPHLQLFLGAVSFATFEFVKRSLEKSSRDASKAGEKARDAETS